MQINYFLLACTNFYYLCIMKKSLFLCLMFCLYIFDVCAATPLKGAEALRKWVPQTVVTEAEVKAYGMDSCFRALPLSDAVFARMKGKSYKEGCQVPRTDLRYLKLLHRNKEGKPQLGELVCHKKIATVLTEVFRKFYEAGYRIERMVLVDEYDADDEKAMTANNTSAFNYRAVGGSKVLSKHSQGLAVDINPLYNPCKRLKTGRVEPAAGKPYAENRDKRKDIPYKIDHDDLCYKLLHAHGFVWGGDWRTVKDYQHFEYK